VVVRTRFVGSSTFLLRYLDTNATAIRMVECFTNDSLGFKILGRTSEHCDRGRRRREPRTRAAAGEVDAAEARVLGLFLDVREDAPDDRKARCARVARGGVIRDECCLICTCAPSPTRLSSRAASGSSRSEVTDASIVSLITAALADRTGGCCYARR